MQQLGKRRAVSMRLKLEAPYPNPSVKAFVGLATFLLEQVGKDVSVTGGKR